MKRLFFHSPIFIVATFIVCGCKESHHDAPDKLKVLSKQAYAFQSKAENFLANQQADSAFVNFLEAKELYVKAHDSIRAAYTLLKSCDVLYAHNDYDELQATAVEALSYMNPKRDTTYLTSAYTFIGLSFAMSGERESAEANFLEAKRYATSDLDKATLDNDIAHANMMAENFGKAFAVLSEAIGKYNFPDSLAIKPKLLDNYGFSAFRTNPKLGHGAMQTALEMRKHNNDASGLVTSYLHLAEASLRSDRESALENATLAEQIAAANHSASDRLEVLRFLVENSDATASKKYAADFVRISDSLQFEQNRTKKAFALIKYNFRKERDERIRQEARRSVEIENERLVRIAWILTSLLLATAIIWLIAYFVRRAQRLKYRTEYETEVRISNRLHDDLANQIHRTIVFVETQPLDEPKNKETLLSRLDAIYSGTRSVSRDNSDVPADADFAKLVHDLLREYNSADCKVIVQDFSKISWHRLAHHKKIAFYRILQELLANMRKHSKCSRAFFSFSESRGKLSLEYNDNGLGSDSQNTTRKNGLQIMENRILKLKGTFTFDSTPGNGFRARIEFPI